MATTPTTLAPTRDLREQLRHEAEVMARYAFATGLSVPASVAEVVERYEPAAPADGAVAPVTPSLAVPPSPAPTPRA